MNLKVVSIDGREKLIPYELLQNSPSKDTRECEPVVPEREPGNRPDGEPGNELFHPDADRPARGREDLARREGVSDPDR